MFKRLQKKQEKAELEEELGLDDDMKQAFGLGANDTDTDESDSDSGSGSGSDSEDDKDGAGEEDRELDSEMGIDEENEASDDDGDSVELDDSPPLPLEEALRNPIYYVSIDTDTRACLVCPQKVLKNNKMVDVHLKSGGHGRRFKKFCDLAQKPKYSSGDPRTIVAAMSSLESDSDAVHVGGLSRREQKRRKKLEVIRKKRETTAKIIQRKKQQKIAKEHTDPKGSQPQPEAPQGPQHKVKVNKKAKQSTSHLTTDAQPDPELVKTKRKSVTKEIEVGIKPGRSREAAKVDATLAEQPRKKRKFLNEAGVATKENGDPLKGNGLRTTGKGKLKSKRLEGEVGGSTSKEGKKQNFSSSTKVEPESPRQPHKSNPKVTRSASNKGKPRNPRMPSSKAKLVVRYFDTSEKATQVARSAKDMRSSKGAEGLEIFN